MRDIFVDVPGNPYWIYIRYGGLRDAGGLIRELITAQKILLISNPTVEALYGEVLRLSLEAAGFEVFTAMMPDGEVYKNIEEVLNIIDQAIDWEIERSSAVVALGGGVVGDLAGFVASIYERGMDFIQVPTTLLSMVDSSIGGKVGVNRPKGKNLIGAFHQPRLVLIDTQTLDTLPQAELLSGLGEVIKYGVIYDYTFFEYLEVNQEKILHNDAKVLETIIERACSIKSTIVAQDEKEAGLRIILNLGHTFGHAIESLGNYETYKHGQSVATGIIMASFLAQSLGYLSQAQRERIESLILQLGLGCDTSGLDSEAMITVMRHDKKLQNGKLRFVLPQGIGHYIISDDIPESLIRMAINNGKAICSC